LLVAELAGTQLWADRRLVAANGGFDQAAAAVAGGLLPSHPALLGDQLDVAVALARRRVAGGTAHRGRTWRDDDGRWLAGLPALDRLVDRLAVVGAVDRDARDLALDLGEQVRHLIGIIGLVARQDAGGDLARAGIESEVELAPGATRPAVLLFLPLALAEQLQPGAVDHQV
jgi:hypothetical protein